ncbi:MAG: YHS domain-containing (seleno)protein [Devosia sp.]
MMRRISKQILTIAIWIGLAAGAHADGLVTTIVSDPLSGVAIDGYDPVSYFTDPEPQPGLPDFEYEWGGLPWYFESAANRDVFSRNPESYAPQFGGHCLMSLSRGYLSDGKPRLYVIEALRLYFFYSTANRDAFLLSKTAAIESAGKHWPDLIKALSGPDAETPASSGLTVADAETSAVAPGAADANVPKH